MDKFLKPHRFEATSADTAAEWTHWQTTFKNFLIQFPDASSDQKLTLLINFVAPPIFTHFADCTSFDGAMTTLDRIYVKQTNEIFGRFQLQSRKQKITEDIDSYITALKNLARFCNYKDVSADVYKEESIRDAMITGICSDTIRQRLLEQETLTLEEAILKARSLEAAHKNAEAYIQPSLPLNVVNALENDDTLAAISKTSFRKNAITVEASITREASACERRNLQKL